jgi:hypothetical protein
MSLGSGLFYSTVLILLAVSFWQISKRKKWKLFGKISAALASVCTLVVTVGYLWNYVSTRPKPVTEFEGVKLGASITDVTVALGAPSLVIGSELFFESRKLSADFNTDISRSLSKLCAYDDGPNLMGFDETTTESEIIEKLGKPDSVSISGDGLSKLISYQKWKAGFSITENLAQLRCMTNGKMAFNDEILPAELSKFDAKKLVPRPVTDPELLAELDGDVPDPCAPDISKAERKLRLSRFGTIRQTGPETYQAGGHRLALSEDTVIACE